MMNTIPSKTSSVRGKDVPDVNDSHIEDAGHVGEDFILQINIVFEKYIELKDALVQSDINKAILTAKVMEQSLDGINMSLLTGDVHKQWMNLAGKLRRALKQIQSSGDIEGQRKDFSTVSNEFYKAVTKFGLTGKTVYYQYCPMAFNDKGAYWLSTTKEIRNPYYGDQMLQCGENRDKLQY